MELTPSPDGIAAVLSVDGMETERTIVDPHKDDAAALARRWLENFGELGQNKALQTPL